MATEEARSIPAWLANVVQELELEDDILVQTDDIRQHLRFPREHHRAAIQELVRRGWLRPLPLRGIFEFIPGKAAGRYPSGDPWILARAALIKWPGLFHVGANSAAWLRGYAQRSPARHILVASSGARIPESLSTEYCFHLASPCFASDTIEGLPIPTPTELFVEVAQLAPRLDLDSAQGWLRRMLREITLDDVLRVLTNHGVSTRARAGYIAEVCDATSIANGIAHSGDIGGGPYYTGPRNRDGALSTRWRVYDTGRIA